MPTQIIIEDPKGHQSEHKVDETVGAVIAKINRAIRPPNPRRFVTFKDPDGKSFSVEAEHVKNINEVD